MYLPENRLEPPNLPLEPAVTDAAAAATAETDRDCDATPPPPSPSPGVGPPGAPATLRATRTTQAQPHTPGNQQASSATTVPVLPGYEVFHLLGEGGMGQVYKARHQHLDRLVAVKVIRPDRLQDAILIDRFRQEARAAARLAHPNIVAIYDAGEAQGQHYLAFEYIEGQNLATYLRQHGPLSIAEACDIVRQAAVGLQAASESGLVHRDLKPANLLRMPDGQIKILDFGLARLAEEERAREQGLTQWGQVMGTPDYLAPEQVRDAHGADIRADIYSLGCTLYQLLTGQVPFPARSPLAKLAAHLEQMPLTLKQARPDVPATLDRLVAKMMAKEPHKRFQTPAEVANSLTPFCQPQARQRRPGLWLAAALTLVLLMAGGTLAAMIIRLQTAQGTLVIEADDQSVEVLVRDSGNKVEIIDLKSRQSVRLDAGTYKLALRGGKQRLKLSTDRFDLERGGKVIVRVYYEAAQANPKPAAPPDQNKTPAPPKMACPTTEPISPLALVQRPTSLPGLKSWTLETRKPRRGYKRIAISPDGKYLAASSPDGTIRLFASPSMKLCRILAGHKDAVISLAWSPDSRSLVSGGDAQDPALCGWDAESGRLLHRWSTELRNVAGLAWSPNGKLLAATNLAPPNARGQNLLVLSSTSGQKLHCWAGDAGAYANHAHIIWTADSQWVAAVSQFSQMLRLWDVTTGQLAQEIDNGRGNQAASWSPDGRQLALGGWNVPVKIWDRRTDKILHSLDVGSRKVVPALAWSPDGKLLAVTCNSSSADISLWQVNTETLLRKIPQGAAPDLLWFPDARSIAGASWGKVYCWDVDTGLLQHLLEPEDQIARSFTADLAGKSLDIVKAGHRDGPAEYQLLDPDTRQAAGMAFTVAGQPVLLNAEGHYYCPTDVSEQLVYIVLTEQGRQEMLTPDEFAARHGWRNDPARVRIRLTRR